MTKFTVKGDVYVPVHDMNFFNSSHSTTTQLTTETPRKSQLHRRRIRIESISASNPPRPLAGQPTIMHGHQEGMASFLLTRASPPRKNRNITRGPGSLVA